MSMKKSKSLTSLINNDILVERDRTVSESSTDVYIINDTSEPDDVLERGNKMADSGIEDKNVSDCDMLVCVEEKIDKLSDLFLEQCRLLTNLKEEIRNYKLAIEKIELTHNHIFADQSEKEIPQRVKKQNLTDSSNISDGQIITNAAIMLNAINSKKNITLDKEITEAAIQFLQSEELKEQMVHATAQSVKDVIGTCLPRDFSSLYLPILERSHRRLVRHTTKAVEDAFIELEENSAFLAESVTKTSRFLHRAIERHQSMLKAVSDPGKNVINTLQYTIEELLHKELKEWRQKVMNMFCEQLQMECLEQRNQSSKSSNVVQDGTPQPVDHEHSILDQLMMSAELKKQINEGNINDAFECALSASDLSLVIFACRAVEPTLVFTQPCKLKQHVLLSLIQQLSTDMVQETQIKCRYLEDAIINLNIGHPDTRAHLPLVVGEVHRHLKKFLSSYPNHMAKRRVTLIVMAVNNLIK